MITEDMEKEKTKKGRTIHTVVQSFCIIVLIILVVVMMSLINKLQGTARVVNYTGLVRGATQREVKLEISENPNEDLMNYLDEILSELKDGNGEYELVSLPDSEYQKSLVELMDYWTKLKKSILDVRQNPDDIQKKNELLEMSEIYFDLANKTVFSAEVYSDKIAKYIKVIEVISAIDMLLLLGFIVKQSISAVRLNKKNDVLAQKAYIDSHTGLLNKNKCEELLGDVEVLEKPTACVMFDINNLKLTNDTWGHSVGDVLIANFAKAIKDSVPDEAFAGRCGGDEFLVVLEDVKEDTITQTLQLIQDEVDKINTLEDNVPISYAQGWAISTDCANCTYRKLFDVADRNMYENKKKMKNE